MAPITSGKILPEKTYKKLISAGYPRGPIIRFLLETSGATLAGIAKRAGVSPPYVTRTIEGTRKSQAVVDTINDIFKFNPWEE